MLLSAIIGQTDLTPKNLSELSKAADTDITSIIYDSRRAVSGSLFVCLRGARADGHAFASSAYELGCRVFAAEEALDLPPDATVLLFENTRIALAELSAAFFAHPERKLKLVGVTGTKGKTSVTEMLRCILSESGINAGSIGTDGITYGDVHEATLNTTPESFELFYTFDRMKRAGVEVCVMEVSSQAYLTHRVHGITFDIGIFTNLAPDHIGEGEHPDFLNYLECKAMLFKNCRFGIFNADDKYTTDMRRGALCIQSTYAIDTAADLVGRNIARTRSDSFMGVSFDACDFSGSLKLRLPRPGKYSVYNALAATAAARRLGADNDSVSRALETCKIPGRFEIVDALDFCTFVIDYAHNGLSMKNLLSTVREYNPSRIVVLFGSVGSRTELRRRELGDACALGADFSIITSDNPDFEDPEAIIDDIELSFKSRAAPYVRITDRAEAIRYAVRHACPGDVIILAGKGHERYQLIRGEHIPFDERSIIENEAQALKAEMLKA